MIDNLGENKIKMKENLKRLDAFLEHAAIPFSTEHINYIKNLIEKIDPQPEISLTDQKSILLKFNKSNGDLLSFEITGDNKVFIAKNTYHEIISKRQIEYDDILMEIILFY